MTVTILLVDDEQSILGVMADCLQDAGYRTSVARNGHEGLALVRKLQPDLVISDVWMPGMDGYHFCRLVRNASNARILMITGVPQEVAVLKEMDVDIDGYLVKPFAVRDFLQVVEKLLEQKGPSSSSVERGQESVETQSKYVDRLLTSKEDRLLEMYRRLSTSDRGLIEEIVVRLLDATRQDVHPMRNDHEKLTEKPYPPGQDSQSSRALWAAGSM